MRSIFAKILLWSLALFALAILALWGISRVVDRHRQGHDLLPQVLAMIEDDSCLAYERGGPEALEANLRRVDAFLPGVHYLTDAQGRDLISGEDRSTLIRQGHSPPQRPRVFDGLMIVVSRPRGGLYRFVAVVRPLDEPAPIWPYFVAEVVVIGLMGSLLGWHLAAPLRTLRNVVDRFGRGDLAARARSSRKDEIGALSLAFDEMAERIETLMDAERRLLQDVSHELRSPLARLGFAVELARTSDDRGAALDRIRRDVDRLSVLVAELLQLTRAEGDPDARDLGPVRLDDLARSLAEDGDLEASAKGCTLSLDLDDECTVRGERELLRRAVENVLRNAIRHAPEDSAIDIILRAEASSAELTIRDLGPGVPDNALAAIFEPFFRVGDDRSRSSGGVGLGLAIARRAVALHGGTIAARNAHPGLAITIELPRATPVAFRPETAPALASVGELG